MKAIFPKKLSPGDKVRVIAPSRSLKIISNDVRSLAIQRLKQYGLSISYSENADKIDDFISSSVQERLDDLHNAFRDKNIHAIFTAIGGYNVNELLDYIDYDLIRNNPKILCGFSDITALSNGIFAKTGLITYSGIHFSSWGMEKGFDYSKEYWEKCFLQENPFVLSHSTEWSDDAWYLDQDNRVFEKNNGPFIINKGKETDISGTIIGGNLGLLNSLQGTPYFPPLDNSILFLEHCADEYSYFFFNRGLQSLILTGDAPKIKAIVIGRFQKENSPSFDVIKKIIQSKKELIDIPVIGGFDFGHTTPIFTFPIGGEASLSIRNDDITLRVEKF